MKKLATLLIAVAILLGLSQCKKNDIVKHNDGTISSVTAMQQGPDIERILNFNKAIQAHRQDPHMRTREVVDIEEAADNIADLFNATYTEPTEQYGETERAEFLITLPVNENGKVLLDDVVEAYEELVALARANYHASALSDKGYICMIAKVEQLSDDEAEVKLTGVYGERKDRSSTNDNYFDENLSWPYKYNADGLCEPTEAVGADDTLEIVIKNMFNISDIVVPDGYRAIVIKGKLSEFSGYDKPDWGLFYRTGEYSLNTCIWGDEMNLLLSNSINAIFTLAPDDLGISLTTGVSTWLTYQAPYKVITLTINGNDPNTQQYITHEYKVAYGQIQYMAIEDDFEGPYDL